MLTNDIVNFEQSAPELVVLLTKHDTVKLPVIC